MFALAYLSTATHTPTEAELEGVLADSRRFNERNALTGALLLHGVTFFQYIEGPEVAVRTAYERIQRARLHRDITVLMLEEVPERYFGEWYMGFAEAPSSLTLQLAQAQWKAGANPGEIRRTPPGVQLLLNFWRGARRDGP